MGATLANSIGGRCVHCNVVNEVGIESAVNVALTGKGKLDIMFNNACIAIPNGSFTNINMDEAKHLLSVNLSGILYSIKHAAKAMTNSRNGGCIICTSSSAAITGGLESHPYTMSKAAIIGLMRSTACELGFYSIRVNCISPHGVPSEMHVNACRRLSGKFDMTVEEVSKIVAESGSLLHGRCLTVDDVAKPVLFLASDDSGFITAHTILSLMEGLPQLMVA